jgi:hypothetical protein
VSASPSLSPRSDYNSSLRETFSGGKLKAIFDPKVPRRMVFDR